MAPPDGPRRGAGEPERVDIPAALAALAVRLDEARGLLGMDRLLERRTELEKAASEPGLWDDADHARQVTTELGRVNEDIDGWVVIGLEPGLRQLAFQRVTEWLPPHWPDPAYPQQLHLDIRVSDACVRTWLIWRCS